VTTDQLAGLVEALIVRVAAWGPDDIGDPLMEHVGLVVADTVGVMTAGGRSSELVALARDPVLGVVGAPTPTARSTVLEPGRRYADALSAAWLNGTAGTVLELDEGFRPTGHPAVHVVPAAMAVAQEVRATGPELGAAVVAGYEVAARLFESFVLPRPMHPHGHFGALGAAVAVAKLRRLDALELARIAATQPLLTGWEACFEGATARNTWSGHANRTGVLAGVLHGAGFTGSLRSLLSVVAPYVVDDAEFLAAGSGRGEVRITRNYFKFHSACALTHSALDAVVEAWRGISVGDPWRIDQIEVATVSPNLRVARPAEPNSLSTRFSLPYAVAAALVTGATGPSSFEWDPQVADFSRRVRVIAEPAFDATWPASAPARVRIVAGSESAEATVRNPRGHHALPPTRDELRDKFAGLVAGPDAPRAARAATQFDRLTDLRAVDDCAALPLDVSPR
jgi:2-methylcitrate dehydratase PrpD